MSLNPRQRAGVEHRGSPLLVLAGAGTGKTRVITHRVAALLEEGVQPWEILAVTFTNKAAAEMRERIAGLCAEREGLADLEVRKLWVGTFHSICARILRQYGESVGLSRNFSIYDAGDQKSLMNRVLTDLGISSKLYSPNMVLGHIDKAKNRGLGTASQAARVLDWHEPIRSVVSKAWDTYARRCRAADACDFGDLLVLAVELLRRAPGSNSGSQLGDLDPVARLKTRFRFVVVDEYQDTNPVQAELVELLCGRAELCVVGDDDQSIYGWRGADVAQILDFPESHPGCEVIRLEQNYRSTSHILDCADAIIRRNTGRLGKTLWSDLGEGHKVRVAHLDDERMEARWLAQELGLALDEGIDPEELAVFYRTHAQSRVLEDELRYAGIGYRLVGGIRFYDRAEIKDLISYLRLLVTPSSDLDVARVINRPARKIGGKTVERLAALAVEHNLSLYEAAGRAEEAGLGTGARRRVEAFHALMEELREECEGMPIDDSAVTILDRTGYRVALATDDKEESQTRLENLQEFVGSLHQYVLENPEAVLAEYLEQISLASDADVTERRESADADAEERKSTRVTLMTVHSAKGLEFERVFVTGMEEQVFPHVRSIGDPDAIEEERRLAYVAVTRAKRQLTMSLVRRRFLFGQTQIGSPSRFVQDLPHDSIIALGQPQRKPIVQPAWSAAAGSPFTDDLEDEKWAARTHEARALHSVPASGARSWDDDIVRDHEDDDESGQQLYIGMQIRHPKFGVGSVAGWDGSGRNMKLTLRFRDHGVKTILARFCEPV